ncbi:MAG: hypothetical protein COU29_00865 [Candidatus Magasanikbacteria bacterium CG10_big_fil_rev_8_21_14_0_10_36_32]|uniref:peptide chain release factor N(5)-glutamine methyltransferase n=1 Tax=Candidatus Magasanikbacteria bacterium CG10_big_fil_rev_8_21_14_0_10_36_32 TaxID=1974646 RepID=A0A2M6W699_9BACT|nr:MAG: hypothetical protein COU29_00865 [Candidatus Magasanikbacteria bacterium CG10_big_fil_rev_8_21_14_0_10_36_32]
MLDIKTIWKKYSEIDSQELIILFSLAIRQSKEFVLSHTDYKMSCLERWRLWWLTKRHKQGWPTAYLARHKEFYGLNFLVNKNTLIPRSSTESMVELVIENLKNNHSEPRKMLIDIGTGTGCIPISIIKTLNDSNIKTIATDISKKALRVAKQNAQRHNVDIQFIHGDLLKPFINNYSAIINNRRLFITANLPYLTQNWIKSEPGIQKEPISALLSDNKHGLSLYEKFFQQIKFIILNFNSSPSIFIEIDSRQSVMAMELAKKYFPKAKIEIKKDLARRDRILTIYQN